MLPNNFSRSSMDSTLSINEGNTSSSFKGSSEKKALKRAKKARLAFRKSKGYDDDSSFKKWLKSLFRKKSR